MKGREQGREKNRRWRSKVNGRNEGFKSPGFIQIEKLTTYL